MRRRGVSRLEKGEDTKASTSLPRSLPSIVPDGSRIGGRKAAPPSEAWIRSVSDHDGLHTPLLVWIDDAPENVAVEVGEACARGIRVIDPSSTAGLVEANLAFIGGNDNAARVCFILGNVRLEGSPEMGTYLNPYAGEYFLRYLCGHSLKAAVLVLNQHEC
ncbi:hypothetical protein NLJ89_g7643 [Agrocybe chaxingu]|uniref:Uncharacterized protein n=1 Tax=Agrocybe chaxingu TaxID=84603 RepID=A0A9W8JWY3_9AGAR|nr:hypothetical protein NLJ89_g7643 [Agrocybe chaxingu]